MATFYFALGDDKEFWRKTKAKTLSGAKAVALKNFRPVQHENVYVGKAYYDAILCHDVIVPIASKHWIEPWIDCNKHY